MHSSRWTPGGCIHLESHECGRMGERSIILDYSNLKEKDIRSQFVDSDEFVVSDRVLAMFDMV